MVAKIAKELFSFLAKQIETFLRTHHNDHFESYTRRRSTAGTEEANKDEFIFQLGFTFSFPVHQIGINKGTLIRWTKGFDIHDAVGKDVCELLQIEIDLLHLPVRVAALANDTVGTLMARSYTYPSRAGTLLGAIFGTGTNGAYVEKLNRITKMSTMKESTAFNHTTGEMIVNTEWGSFDNQMSVLPNTPYDIGLDKESVNPGIQMFEKRVSGMFLGEILRRAILALVEDPEVQLFKDEDSSSNELHSTTTIAEDSALYTRWGIDTSFLSFVAADNSPHLNGTRQLLWKELKVDGPSEEDARAVKTIAAAIAKRSARLSAVAIGAVVISSGRLETPASSSGTGRTKSSIEIVDHVRNLEVAEAASATIQKLQSAATPLVDSIPPEAATDVLKDTIDVGVDGSLVEFYPGFEEYVREALREIPEIGPAGERRITIGIAKDGSGVGAALIALVAGAQEPPQEAE